MTVLCESVVIGQAGQLQICCTRLRVDRGGNVTWRRSPQSCSSLCFFRDTSKDSMASAEALKDLEQHNFPPALSQDNQRASDLAEATVSGTTTPTSSRPTSTTGFTAALPPVDTGYAWIFLAAGFVIGESANCPYILCVSTI